jgi:hypothetical protein
MESFSRETKKNVGVVLVNSFTWRKTKNFVREQRRRMMPPERLEGQYLSYIAVVHDLVFLLINKVRYN